jgi:hypothetical protein
MVGFAAQVGFLVAASISPGMDFDDQPQPPELRATSGGVTATPTSGTYCRDTRAHAAPTTPGV